MGVRPAGPKTRRSNNVEGDVRVDPVSLILGIQKDRDLGIVENGNKLVELEDISGLAVYRQDWKDFLVAFRCFRVNEVDLKISIAKIHLQALDLSRKLRRIC